MKRIANIFKLLSGAFGALLCGAFVSLGVFSFDLYDVISPDWMSLVALMSATFFFIISAYGIFRQPSILLKCAYPIGQIAAAVWCGQWCVPSVMLVLYAPLFILLVFAADWRGARFSALPLSLIFAWGIAVEGEAPERLPVSAYLPISVLSESPGCRIVAFGEDAPAEWWKSLPYVSVSERILTPADVRRIAAAELRYNVAVAGNNTMLSGRASRRRMYVWLERRLDKDGIMVLPADDVELLPGGGWRFALLPGGDGVWLAARRGAAPEVDSECLDMRLQHFLRFTPRDSQLLLPGAFAALYPRSAPREVFVPASPRCSASRFEFFWWHASLALLVWLAAHLMLCRGERTAQAVVSGENAAAMILYSAAMVPVWAENEICTGVSTRLLLAGIGLFMLPVSPGKNRLRWVVAVGIAVGLLPLLPGMAEGFVPGVCWLLWMFSGAALFSDLSADYPAAVFGGALAGAVFGGALYFLLSASSVAVFPAAVIAAAVLRLSGAFRR